MKPLKIIHLSSLSTAKKTANHPTIDDDHYYLASWAGTIARRLKKYNPDLDIEVWRADNDFNEKSVRYINHMRCIMWPHKKVLLPNIFTLDMVRELNVLSRSYFIILNYHSLFAVKLVILIKIFCPKVRLMLLHHGGLPPKVNSLKDIITRISYKKNNIAYATYQTKINKDYLTSIKNSPPMKFLPVGADFEYIKPIDKHVARKELKLEDSQVYGIYVGPYSKVKNVELIIEAYNSLKSQYNFNIIMVGGREHDELYQEVLESGMINFGQQPYPNMKNFYSAADFYIQPIFCNVRAGLDVAVVEAWACNIPAITTRLKELDFDSTELGIQLEHESELITKTEWLINNLHEFKHCREVAQRHLDGNESIMKQLCEIYYEIYPK